MNWRGQGSGIDDTITGSSAADTIFGGDGNDTIEAVGGGLIEGNAGDDTFIVKNNNVVGDTDTLEGDLFDGGTGTDLFDASNELSAAWVIILDAGTVDRGASGVRTVALANFELANFENVIGSQLGDLITGDSNANVLQGIAGDDTINGGGDVIDGGTGQDTIDGGDGFDLLTGGAGADIFVFRDNFGEDVITDFGGGDVARVFGLTPGFDSFSDFDVTGDGVIDANDAALTSNVTATADFLELSFNASGTLRILFEDVTSLGSSDLDPLS
ncbi:Ca2+-binding RTX toxin-like protein [Roseovarius sp. MBR-154]